MIAHSMVYVAVLPAYRHEAIAALRRRHPAEFVLCCAPAHLDPTVRTGIPSAWYTEIGLKRLAGGRFYLLTGQWSSALRATDLLVDFNPRCLNTWAFLLLRKLSRKRRTLVWGHLYPQAGASARTTWLRRSMRRLADGFVSYTYSQAVAAKSELPRLPVFVAPNSLYSSDKLSRATPQHEVDRTNVVYVGRLVPQKKVDVLVDAFASSRAALEGARLVIVGDGSQRRDIENQIVDLGIGDRVELRSWAYDFEDLREIYARAFASASPGFAGLGLTQSAGFGVPMIVAPGEPHSPEIELAQSNAVEWSRGSSPLQFGQAIDTLWAHRHSVPRKDVQKHILSAYCAEAMADGLGKALRLRTGIDMDGDAE